MSSTDEHKEADASAAALARGTCREDTEPPRVAPAQLFASPFLPEHERAIVTVLHQVFPSRKISRAALTILQRFSDRLAHYLIPRAYLGLNGGVHAALAALCKPPFVHAVSVASASAASSSAPADPHKIHFAFDEPLWSALGELRGHAHTEAVKAQTKLSEVGDDGLAVLRAAKTYGFMFPLVLADRWLQDFTLGLRFTDEDAVLPPSLHSTDQKASLCALVEYIFAEMLYSAGSTATTPGNGIQSSHLFLVVERDAELQALCAFLPVDWRIDAEGIESPLQLACTSRPLDAVHHSTRFLEFAFAPHTVAQADLNRSSWDHDSAAVIEAARLAARGELVESPLSRQLRKAHVRPPRFWGVDQRMPLAFERKSEAAGHEFDRSARESATVSILLTDANGRAFELVVRGRRGKQPSAVCFVLRRDSCRDQIQRVASIFSHQPESGWPESALSLTVTVDPSKLVGYKPHGVTTPLAVVAPAVACTSNEAAAEHAFAAASVSDDSGMVDDLAAAASTPSAFSPTSADEAAAAASAAVADGSSAASSTKRKIDQTEEGHDQRAEDNSSAAVSSSSHAHKKARQDEKGSGSLSQSTNSSSVAAASASSAASSSSSAAAASSSSSAVPSSSSTADVLSSLHSKQREAQLKEHTAAELKAAFEASLPLLKFSLFGPTLFADNHPPPLRRLFTAHLVDECMLRAGLTPLPLVLSELIADYHSFDLPFREDKAVEQMRRAGFKLRKQDSDKATYEGQLDSAVERVRDAEAELDDLFPVADLEEDAEAPADEGDVAAGAEEDD